MSFKDKLAMFQNLVSQNSNQTELKKAQERRNEQSLQINIVKDYNKKIRKEIEKREEEEQKRKDEEFSKRKEMLQKQKQERDIKFEEYQKEKEEKKEKEKIAPFESIKSKLKIYSNLETAPDHSQNETKKIVQLLEENTFIQNNEISIEIIDDPNENQNTTTPTPNNNSLITFSTKIYEMPQPSKVVKKAPTKYQICLIYNETIREPQHFENEVRTKYVQNDEDFQKITRFNELFLKKLTDENEVKEQAPIKGQEQIEKNLSMFRSKRKKRVTPKC